MIKKGFVTYCDKCRTVLKDSHAKKCYVCTVILIDNQKCLIPEFKLFKPDPRPMIKIVDIDDCYSGFLKRILMLIIVVVIALFLSSCINPTSSSPKYDYEEECKVVAIEQSYTGSCRNYNDNTTYPCSRGGAKTYSCPDGIEYKVRN